MKLEDGLITARAPGRFASALSLLRPGCTIAVEYENVPEDRHFVYHTLQWAEMLSAPISRCVYLKLKTVL